MIARRKTISLEEARLILKKLREEPKPVYEQTVSLGEFIRINLDDFERSGRSVRAIHEFLIGEGLDVGSLETFRVLYSRARRRRRHAEKHDTEKREESGIDESKTEKMMPESTVAVSRGMGLRPLRLPDGTEMEVDTTGGRSFKI